MRCCRQEVFFMKDVLQNSQEKMFAKFTRKQLFWSLFSNKVTAVSSLQLYLKRLLHKIFNVNFATFLRTPSLQNTYSDYFRNYTLLLSCQNMFYWSMENKTQKLTNRQALEYCCSWKKPLKNLLKIFNSARMFRN